MEGGGSGEPGAAAIDLDDALGHLVAPLDKLAAHVTLALPLRSAMSLFPSSAGTYTLASPLPFTTPLSSFFYSEATWKHVS
jgi:hypothetical protein